jgi:hypothetical protein
MIESHYERSVFGSSKYTIQANLFAAIAHSSPHLSAELKADSNYRAS